MMTDFRELCTELVDDLAEFQWAVAQAGVGWTSPDTESLIDRARAAVAQSEPEAVGPTDKEIEEWADASAEVPLEALDPDVGGWQRCFNSTEFCQMVRAVLAHWGHPKPRERLDIKAILQDPTLAAELIEGATDFICKVEGIRPRRSECADQLFDHH